jgi:hypothetical protein
MGKNLLFLADGTWNGPGHDLDDDPVSAQPSNVLKLYHWLAGHDTLESTGLAGEAERVELDPNTGAPLQVAKYLDGVGYDHNWLAKIIGGVFGAGLVTRIVRGYTYVSRNYQAGDRITLVGFSRGAYTARALAGLILEQGLLDPAKLDLDDREAAYRAGCAVWASHQKRIRTGFLDRIEGILFDLPGFFSKPPAPGSLLPADLETVAVWDTVGAMGIPQYSGEDERLDAFRFANTQLDLRVHQGFHALSLDEQRPDFTPTLWDARDRLTQTLFPGAHADIGGGYPMSGGESGLSDGALSWMQSRLAELPNGAGIHFGAPPAGIQPSAAGPAHQPWNHVPYLGLNHGPRRFPNGQGLLPDPSVAARMAADNVVPDPGQPKAPYYPGNLPKP